MPDNKIQAFKAEVQQKISNVLEEFAQGKLNREQFHAIYERYNSQLELADKALDTDSSIPNDGSTIAIREKFMGKAQGLIIFSNKTGNIIETLGEFGMSMTELIPVLDDFTTEWQGGHVIDRAVRRTKNNQWLLFAAGQHTIIATLFTNEPSGYQIDVIRRMHREFEEANQGLLTQEDIDAEQLVYPFYSFVRRNLRG